MPGKTKIWYLQNFNLFDGLDKESMEALGKNAKMRMSKKKEILYFPEDPSDTIYMLKEGKVKISRISAEGKTTTLGLVGPGEIFGEAALLGQDKHENIAEAAEDAVICVINKNMFQGLMDMNPKLQRKIYKFIGFRFRKVEALLEDLVFKTAQERIESFLKRYVQDFGKKMVDGWMVRPFLTHQEIADLTATARQTVNVVLNDLARNGFIKFSRRNFRVLNNDWLTK